MKNKLIDLNNHLFLQLERVNDEKLSGDELKEELHRSAAVTNIAKAIVSNASLALKAQRMKREHGVSQLPKMIEEERE